MRLLLLLPHYPPDTAPTGLIGGRLATELAALGHDVEVVTALPWYREHAVASEWRGLPLRRRREGRLRVTRVHPFPTGDKRNLPKRAVGFAGFCALAAAVGAIGRRVDAVIAMTPPLPMAATGWLAARARGGPLLLNVQDVFPDVAVELGLLRGRRVIAACAALERWSYARCAAITVLSEGTRANLAAKVRDPGILHVVPNFTDIAAIIPMPRENGYRAKHGLGDATVVMYAGNVGLSQSLDLLLDAARHTLDRPDLLYVINGAGSTRPRLEAAATDLPNVRFVDFAPAERLSEVLAAADLHVVPLKSGLARSSVPSKTYAVLAAARPLLVSVDVGSEVARIVSAAGAGVAVAPEDPAAFRTALLELVTDRERLKAMGASGRAWVERATSPAGVAAAYDALLHAVVAAPGRGDRPPASLQRSGTSAAPSQRRPRGAPRILSGVLTGRSASATPAPTGARTAAEGKLRVLFFGSYDAARHPRVAVLRDGLRAHGDEVVEINVPLGLDTAGRVGILQRPWLLPLFVARLLACWGRLALRVRRARRTDPAGVAARPDAVVVGYLGHFDVLLARRQFPHTPVVLDHLVGAADTATDRGSNGSVVQALLRRLDARALAAAEIPIVDTVEHLALVGTARARTLVIPVGAPDSWLAAGRAAAATAGRDVPLRVIFFGLFTPLQGAPVIGAALGLLAPDEQVEALLCGSGQDLLATCAAAAGNPRVRWREWVEPAMLPGLVASYDVCLGIFGTGPKALRVVPNKVYQGAAAGSVVVTSDTAPQRSALGSAAVFVPPGDPAALAAALSELARDPALVARLRAASAARAARHFAPATVVTDLRERLLSVRRGEGVDVPNPGDRTAGLAPSAGAGGQL